MTYQNWWQVAEALLRGRIIDTSKWKKYEESQEINENPFLSRATFSSSHKLSEFYLDLKLNLFLEI